MDAIFGDSRAWYGLTGIPGFVNNAFGGDSLYDTGEKIRWHFRDRTGFRTIIALSPENFMTRTPRADTGRAGARHLPPILLPGERQRSPQHVFFLRLLSRSNLQDMGDMAAKGRVYRALSPLRRWRQPGGRATGAASEAAVDIAIKIARGDSHLLSKFPVRLGYIFRQLLKWLEMRRATVCIITPPPFHPYSDQLSGSAEYRAFFGALQQEIESHGFRYVNYFWNNLPITDFTDAFHMNSDGARDFSARVARDCV